MNDRKVKSTERKILIATTVSSTLSAFLLPFADHFRALGWEVEAAAAGVENDPGCATHFDTTWDMTWSRRPRDPANLKAVGDIREIVAEGGHDLVHVHTPVAGFITRLALRDMRRSRDAKVVYTAHGLHSHPEGRALANAAFCALERLAGRWTDALLVINREDHGYALKHKLAGRGQLYHMPGIGVDLDYYSRDSVSPLGVAAFKKEIGAEPSHRVLLMVAEFTPGKRHTDAVRALAALGDPNLHLVLAGSGPLLETVGSLVADLGLGGRVHFLGLRHDVPALLAAASALVLPSAREGLPRTVLEAMAMGTPVVGSRIRGTNELLEDGCGFLVDLGDVTGLAKAIRAVLDNPAEAEAMTHKARAKVQRYSLSRVLALHEEVYGCLLSVPR